MEAILAHAQKLVYTLLSLMPSQYQRVVKTLPQALTKRYQVMILVDTAFGTNVCVLLHLVMEYTFNFPGARYEFSYI